MSLALPQPDFDPAPLLRMPDAACNEPSARDDGPGDEDEDADPVGLHGKLRFHQLLMVYTDRR